MKHLYLIFSILAISLSGSGQSVKDSVIIYIDNRIEIKVAIPDYSHLGSTPAIITDLESFQSMMSEIGDQVSPGSADLLRLSVGNSLTVEPGDPKQVYLIKEGELSMTGARDLAVINGEGYLVYITTTDISKIADISLSACLENVLRILPDKTPMSKTLFYECINGKTIALEDRHKTNPPVEFLEFSLGAGASLVRNNWAPDISFGIGIGLFKKGRLRFPYLSSNILFDFDAENNIHSNTFLNVGIGWTTNLLAKRKEDFLGIEFGYLVQQKGDLFKGNTFKFGMNWSPVKGVTLNPHLYLTDDFKSLFPGIRIGFGF